MSLIAPARRSARRPFLVCVVAGLAAALAGPVGAALPAGAATSSSSPSGTIIRRPDPPRLSP